MRHLSRIVLFISTCIISMTLMSSISYAVENESISEIDTTQQQMANVIQPYVNEPLDNAVPVIYKYEIISDDENVKTSVVPGEEFTLQFTVYNPAVVSKIGNVRIVVTQEDSLVYPKYGSTNSVYVGYIEPLSYVEGKIRLIASKDIVNERVGLVLYMTYTDNYNTLNSQQIVATIPISTSGTLDVNNLEMPTNMFVGANNRFSITYQNSGLSSINDVTLHIEGEKIESQDILLGNISSGSSKTSDVYLKFNEPGMQNIDMYFTYAGNDGQIQETVKNDYRITVSSYSDENSSYAKDEFSEERNNQNRILSLAVVIICVATVGLYLVVQINKRRYEKALMKGEEK